VCVYIDAYTFNRESEGARVAAFTRENRCIKQRAQQIPTKGSERALQNLTRACAFTQYLHVCACIVLLSDSNPAYTPTHTPNPQTHSHTQSWHTLKKNHVTHPHPHSLFSHIYTHTPEVQGGPRASRDIPCRPSSTDLNTASTGHTQYICIYMYI